MPFWEKKGRFETPYRKGLYKSISNEEVSAYEGTPYPCDHSGLERCLSLISSSSIHPRPVQSPEQASSDLERFLEPLTRISSTVQAAIDRLRAGLLITDWKPDLIIKAFCDLDVVFFAGKLRGRTSITWHSARWWIDEERSRDGHRYQLAMTRYMGNGKAAIHLNAWAILLDTPDAATAMWSVVIHEMVHAYEHVMCGSSPPTPYDLARGWDDGHGLMFRQLIRPVHERAMRLLNIPVIKDNYTQDHREENYQI